MSAENNTKQDKMIGHEVRLDPTKGGMLMDPGNDFNFNFVKNDDGEVTNDRMKVTDKTDLTIIDRNVKVGILRVFTKKGKDVTEKFGGPAKFVNRKPIVKKGFTDPKTVSTNDEKLIAVLNINDIDKIEKYVNGITDYATIMGLIDLEKQGNNPTYSARRSIIDMLVERAKSISGMTPVGKEEGEDEEIQVKL